MNPIKKIIEAFKMPDSIVHLKGGFALLIGWFPIMLFSLLVGLHPVTATLLCMGISGAASVEGAQWFANKAAAAEGRPVLHGISVRDFIMSVLPCGLAALVFEICSRFGMVPSYQDMMGWFVIVANSVVSVE